MGACERLGLEPAHVHDGLEQVERLGAEQPPFARIALARIADRGADVGLDLGRRRPPPIAQLLGDRLERLQLVGAAIVIAGIVTVQLGSRDAAFAEPALS